MERRPLMMGGKSDENSRALAQNETVGENYSPTSKGYTGEMFFYAIENRQH